MESTSPRVAIFYWVISETGYRNDGAPLYAFHNLKKILGKSNVLHFNPDPTTPLDHFGKFDLHLLVDHGEDNLPVPPGFVYPHPNAYWVSDTHIDAKGYAYRLETAKKFDTVFVCQKRAMDEFIRDGVDPKKIVWLPHAFEPEVYKPANIVEKYDWAFVGHLNSPHRVALMDAMLKTFPNGYIGWRFGEFPGWNVFEEACRKFNLARMVVSDSIVDDINMRTFEALGSHRPLLTKAIPTLPELFTPGVDLETYTSIPEALEKAKWLLDHPQERDAMAENGYQKALAQHTYQHRMETILKTCLNYEPKGVVPC